MTREELFHIQIPQTDERIFRRIKDNWNNVAKPLDGLGRLETIFCRIGAAQDSEVPEVSPRAILILCADNGIVAEGVSQSGQEVTLAVARNMGNHGSAVCKMAALAGLEVIPVDIGINATEEIPGVLNRKVASGTADFLKEPAMKEEEVLKALETGISLVRECRERGIRILATGEMGIGNTTTSTAVTAGILGLDVGEITGRGAGLSRAGIRKKADAIREGLDRYGFLAEQPGNKDMVRRSDTDQMHDPARLSDLSQVYDRARVFEILRCVGGLDIAGLCGVFIGGALYRIPVVIDGLISAAAALCAECLLPGCRQFMLASHIGSEQGMKYILAYLGLKEVIHADLALGEGTGAVMLFPLLDMAMEVYQGSSTFDEIGVGKYQRHEK